MSELSFDSGNLPEGPPTDQIPDVPVVCVVSPKFQKPSVDTSGDIVVTVVPQCVKNFNSQGRIRVLQSARVGYASTNVETLDQVLSLPVTQVDVKDEGGSGETEIITTNTVQKQSR